MRELAGRATSGLTEKSIFALVKIEGNFKILKFPIRNHKLEVT